MILPELFSVPIDCSLLCDKIWQFKVNYYLAISDVTNLIFNSHIFRNGEMIENKLIYDPSYHNILYRWQNIIRFLLNIKNKIQNQGFKMIPRL